MLQMFEEKPEPIVTRTIDQITGEISVYKDTDIHTIMAIQAAEKFLESGANFRDVVLKVWIDRAFENATYNDGVGIAHFGGDTEEERFADWLRYVCMVSKVSDSVRSSLFGFCTIVVPMIEDDFISHTLTELKAIPDSISNRVVSVARRILKEGYTEETAAKIDHVITTALNSPTSLAFEEFLRQSNLVSPRNVLGKPKDVPVIDIIDGNKGTIFIIKTSGPTEYEFVQRLLSDIPRQYADPDDGYFERIVKELNDGVQSTFIKVGVETEADYI